MNGWDNTRLRQVYEEAGISRSELAEKCGIARKSLNNIMAKSNPVKPGTSVLKLLAINLGVTVEYLLGKNLERQKCKPKTILRPAKSAGKK